MTNDIPAGYQIIFSTWENDGNAAKTKVRSGIQSAEDVRFLLALASRFASRNSDRPGLGGEYPTVDQLIEVVDSTLARFPDISSNLRAMFEDERDICLKEGEDDEDLADRWYDLICDIILDYPEDEHYCDEPRFCRVFEEATIYYFEQPIADISADFT